MLILLAGLTATSSLLSTGIYHEDDLKHFLFARWSKHDVRYLLDDWGRPGFTVPYALPSMIGNSQIGWHAARLLSVTLAAATAWLTFKNARMAGLRHAWLALLLIYAQPLFLRLSLTTLTETPLAFYFALSTFLLLKRRPVLSAAVFSLCPVTRHEAIVLLPVWALAMWRQRAHFASYLLLIWAPLLHNIGAGYALEQMPIERFFKPDDVTHYGQGTLLTYVPRLLLAAGIVPVALAILGVKRFLRPGLWIIAVCPIMYFAAETLIYMRGAYASGGYARFLVPIAPWVAILAAAGARPAFLYARDRRRFLNWLSNLVLVMAGLWIVCEIEWLIRPMNIQSESASAVRLAMMAARAVVFILVCAGLILRLRATDTRWHRAATVAASALVMVIALTPAISASMPMKAKLQHRILAETAEVIEKPPLEGKPLIAVNYWIYYWSNRWLPQEIPPWYEAVANAPSGAVFCWDQRFCLDPDFGLTLRTVYDWLNWRVIYESASLPGEDQPFAVVLQKTDAPAETE